MKPVPLAAVSFLILCGFGIWPAQAQVMRGPVGAARGVANAPHGSAAISAGARQSANAGRMSKTHTLTSLAPGRSSMVAPFRLNHGDFRRHHRFHRYPQYVIIEVPAYIGPTEITTEFIPNGWSPVPLTENSSIEDLAGGPGQLAPFDPTPQEVVERMLALAAIKKGDVVYDLGAGDGRVVVTAAKKYGVRAVGFEIDPGLVKLAREKVREQRVEKLVEIRQEAFMKADLSPATVVTLYLSYDGNLALRPKLMRELKPRARVVSYAFDMGDWQPKIAESYRDAAGNRHMLYLWQMGEPLAFTNTTTTDSR